MVKQVDDDGVEKPVMHACGHDMHVACLMTAASKLHAERTEWKGTLVIIFQPAEERGSGAKAMIKDSSYITKGCPIPDAVLGQHVVPYPAGSVGVRTGSFMAAVDFLEVTVYGSGGHGSAPQYTIDPVVLASFIVIRLQSIVSREVEPMDPVVVSVGVIQASATANVIVAEATLKINVRTFNAETRVRVLAAIEWIVKAECQASNSPEPPLIKYTLSVPGTVNDQATADHLSAAFMKYFGSRFMHNIDRLKRSKDVSFLETEGSKPKPEKWKGSPVCFWNFGSTDPAIFAQHVQNSTLGELPINYSPFYAPLIEPTLETGRDALVVAAKSYLPL